MKAHINRNGCIECNNIEFSKGDVSAQLNLGLIYYQGQGVQKIILRPLIYLIT